MTAEPAHNDAKPQPPPPRPFIRKWLRRLMLLTIAVVLLTGIAAWLVTRSWFIVAQLKPALEGRLGGLVSIGNATYEGGNRVLITDLIVRARSLQGEAGQIAHVKHVQVGVDLAGILKGNVWLSDVEMDGLILRLSEDLHQAGRMNFMLLDPQYEPRPKWSPPPPKIQIRNALIEYGMHEGDQYTHQGQRRMAGEMYPTVEFGWYNFELVETDDTGLVPKTGGVHVKGDWNAKTNEHSAQINGVTLNDQTKDMLPLKVRALWEEMTLEGRVDTIREHWTPGAPLSIDFEVDNVAMTLPLEAQEIWARYRDGQVEPTRNPPRMRVRGGTIHLATDRVWLDQLEGEISSSDPGEGIVPVPYSVSLTIESLPRLDWDQRDEWMQQVLTLAPFTLNFKMNDFSLKPTPENPNPAIDLPRLVATAMSKFSLTDWVLSTSVDVTRGAPTFNEKGEVVEGPLTTKGQAYIQKANGKYLKFAYPLRNVDAYVQFDNDKVVVQYLNGDGSGDGKIRISGEIAPPNNDGAVALRLVGTNLPVDDALRQALKPTQADALDMMFHQPSFESLTEAGMIPDEADISVLQQERATLAAQLELLKAAATSGDIDAKASERHLQRQLDALQARIDVGPFHLGAMLDVDLKIQREFGDIRPTDTIGTLTIRQAGVIYDRFPYPLKVVGGAFELGVDSISIDPGPDGQGLPIRTLGGGKGWVSGGLVLPKSADAGLHGLKPNLHFKVEHDHCNDVLFAAIPLNRVEREQDDADATKSWPGGIMARSALLIRGVGLEGELACSGHVGADDDGKINYAFELKLSDGLAQPTQQLAGAMGAAGLLWPAGFTLEQVSGTVKVSSDGVRIEQFVGQHLPMTLAASGSVDIRSENSDTKIDITINDMPIGQYVINLVPPEQMSRAKAMWERYQPSGTFGASLEYRASLDTGERTRMNVFPSNLTILLDEQRIGVQRAGGDLRLEGGLIEFVNFAVDLSAGEQRSDGQLTLNGRYSLAEGAEAAAMNGSWKGGRFESPVITEALWLMGAEQAATDYRGYHPSGSFDAKFELKPPVGGRAADYLVTIQPKDAAVTINQTPIYAQFQRGEVVVAPALITLRDIAGEHAGGSFEGGGTIKTSTPVEVAINVSYDGRLVSGQVLAFLPQAARQALADIQFQDGGPSKLTDGKIRLVEVPATESDVIVDVDFALGATADPPTTESKSLWSAKWRTDFSGQIQTQGASFTAGLPFTELDGTFDVTVHHEPGRAPQMDLFASTTHMRTLGQELGGGCWPVQLSSDGQTVTIPWFRANARNGVVDGQATFNIGESAEYQAQVNLVGVPLDGFRRPVAEGVEGVEGDVANSPPPTGEVYASVGIAGVRGDPESRVGRGTLRVINGHMASVPLLMQIVKMTQFTAPVVGDFNGANVEMYLKGDRVIFEEILFESTLGNNALLQLIGEGEMNFDTLELDTRFRSRGGVALVRDIVGGVSDQLYQIEVTGPLTDPQARVIALPGMSSK